MFAVWLMWHRFLYKRKVGPFDIDSLAVATTAATPSSTAVQSAILITLAAKYAVALF